jgi:hypothetical protein
MRASRNVGSLPIYFVETTPVSGSRYTLGSIDGIFGGVTVTGATPTTYALTVDPSMIPPGYFYVAPNWDSATFAAADTRIYDWWVQVFYGENTNTSPPPVPNSMLGVKENGRGTFVRGEAQ